MNHGIYLFNQSFLPRAISITEIKSNPAIDDYILRRLKHNKWSPDVISVIMKRDIDLSVSPETIYNYIYNSPKSRSLKLYQLLPIMRSLRLKHGSRRKKISTPKKLDINLLTDVLLQEIEDILNNMPRKILGYKTPNQVWNEVL